ncbi:hypothetical protein DITRI_Ditri04bG0064900 [Diplodiscus trichospermus]
MQSIRNPIIDDDVWWNKSQLSKYSDTQRQNLSLSPPGKLVANVCNAKAVDTRVFSTSKNHTTQNVQHKEFGPNPLKSSLEFTPIKLHCVIGLCYLSVNGGEFMPRGMLLQWKKEIAGWGEFEETEATMEQQVSSNEGPEAPQSCTGQPWAAPRPAFGSYSGLHLAFEVASFCPGSSCQIPRAMRLMLFVLIEHLHSSLCNIFYI